MKGALTRRSLHDCEETAAPRPRLAAGLRLGLLPLRLLRSAERVPLHAASPLHVPVRDEPVLFRLLTQVVSDITSRCCLEGSSLTDRLHTANHRNPKRLDFPKHIWYNEN